MRRGLKSSNKGGTLQRHLQRSLTGPGAAIGGDMAEVTNALTRMEDLEAANELS